MRSSAILIIVLMAALAHAQPPGKTRDKPRAARKSPAVALGWSLGLTVVGSALIVGGIARDDFDGPTLGIPIVLVGPSVGRWYAGGRDFRTFPGLFLRGASAVVSVLVFTQRGHCTDDCTPEEAKNFYLEGQDKAVIYGLGAIFFASAIYDVVRAPLDARDANRANGIALVATAAPGGAGLAIGGQF